MKIVSAFILVVFFTINSFAMDTIIIDKTASHICKMSKDKNRHRLAVYTFTDNDKETESSKTVTTKIIAKIINCSNLKVLDPAKLKKILEEQSKGMSGIIDEKTAPETGKLIGADALIFGKISGNVIQVRIIDATTGEILAATVAESDKTSDKERVVIKIEKMDKETGKKEFKRFHLRKVLKRLARNRPVIFLLITSTDRELKKLENRFPEKYSKFMRILRKSSNKLKKEKFYKKRKFILDLRIDKPRFNKVLKNRHKRIIRRLIKQNKRGFNRRGMRSR